MSAHNRPFRTHKHGLLHRFFPVPSFVATTTAGLDISDTSIKWMELVEGKFCLEVGAHGLLRLKSGIVEEGVVQDVDALAKAVQSLRESIGGTQYVHVALPEEAGYIFGMVVSDTEDHEQVLHKIEFELEGRVPLKADQAIYDYDVVGPTENGVEISVSVFPESLVSGYIDACAKAGLLVRSLEIESSSIARATIDANSSQVTLLADFGRARTGFAILKGQIPIFTSTVSVGGTKLTDTVTKALEVDEEEANEFKDNVGLTSVEDDRVYQAVLGTAATLSDEILRHYRYWDTRRNGKGERLTPVAQVLLAGGSATLRGLPDYIASRVQAPTKRVNVWQNVCSFDNYIPPIERKQSLGFATSIGLALRNM